MSRKKTPIIEIHPELLALAQRRGFNLAPLKIHGEVLFYIKDRKNELLYDGKSFFERELLSLLRREVKS